MESNKYVLELKNISKSFPGVKALEDVSLKIKPASIHALIGENGAGKSTLMKCLFGIYKPDAGDIVFQGEKVEFKGPHESIKQGISMIHQELTPLKDRTVAQNIFVGREPYSFLFMTDNKKIVEDTTKLFEKLKIEINPNTKMGDLTVAKMQLVEIAKAVSYDSKIVVMDEPSSSLTISETELLFEIIRQLKKDGVSIIFITHKMNEVFEIADEVTVLRDGKLIKNMPIEDTDENQLVSLMVGREMNEMFPKKYCPIGDVVLKVDNLSCEGVFQDVSFEVRSGEILGFAGLIGAGRTEIMETIFGIRKKSSGRIVIKGKEVDIKDPADAIKNGLGMVTEDRRGTGIIPQSSVEYNIVIANLLAYLSKLRCLYLKKMRKDAKEYAEKLKVKTPSINTKIANLSGGNQQKALVAKWLLTSPDILVVDEPTRGIDVGAKAEIHGFISQLAAEGKAILIVSSEMTEILSVSDRIVVMHEGSMTGILDRAEFDQETIMNYATGIKNLKAEGKGNAN